MNSVVITPSLPLASNESIDAGFRVEVVSDYETLLGMRTAWDELLAESTDPSPFLGHAWFRVWWRCFGAGKRLHVLAVRSGAKLIGIAPLMLGDTRIYGVSVRRLSFLENDHTPRCGFILSRAAERQAYSAIWNALHADRRWDVLELNHVPAGCATLEHLSAQARDDRYLTGVRQLERSPYVPLQGDWESYFKRLSYNHRRNIRKHLNRLKRRGDVELEIVACSDSLAAVLEDGLRIEAAAWKEDNGTAMRSDAAVRRFYEAYAQSAAAAGTLRLLFLKVDGVRIAFSYGIHACDRLYVLKAGYDPAYSRYSPYHLLCYLVLQDCFARGLAEYDFLGHNEPWKLDWEPQTRSHQGSFVFRRRWYTFLLHSVKCRLVPLLQRQAPYLRLRDVLSRRRRHRRMVKTAAVESNGDER
ncbi:MAG TPA: GNAT family N-acetyltransferase [Burkholderiales bacterium]|nr:GNAT family N-acetyltransferase [Burkholderiales bacterium]